MASVPPPPDHTTPEPERSSWEARRLLEHVASAAFALAVSQDAPDPGDIDGLLVPLLKARRWAYQARG